jgi:hypothetical protein
VDQSEGPGAWSLVTVCGTGCRARDAACLPSMVSMSRIDSVLRFAWLLCDTDPCSKSPEWLRVIWYGDGGERSTEKGFRLPILLEMDWSPFGRSSTSLAFEIFSAPLSALARMSCSSTSYEKEGGLSRSPAVVGNSFTCCRDWEYNSFDKKNDTTAPKIRPEEEEENIRE